VKSYWKLYITLVLLFLLAGCQGQEPVEVKPYKVVMLLARGGQGDRSFSDAAYSGLKEVMQDKRVIAESVPFVSPEVNEEVLVSKIEFGVDLVIGVGYECKETIAILAKKYPEVRFGIVDTVVANRKNVTSIVFREEEGDFLMGVVAARLTKKRKLGFIGGVDIPVVRRIQQGFIKGVHYVDPTIPVVVKIVGSFGDPETGKEMAFDLYASGVDIIYHAAGKTGLGVVEAAGNSDGLTLGASGDHRNLAPGSVIGNRPKNVGKAVKMLVQQGMDGTASNQVISLGLREHGILFGPFADWALVDGLREELVELRTKIVNGELAVN